MTKEVIPHAKDLLGDASTQLFINQLLLAIVLRNGGRLTVPIEAVDGTGGYSMDINVDPVGGSFALTAKKKQ